MLLKILLLSIVTGIVGINTPFNVDKTIKYDEIVTTESIKQRNYQHTDWLNNNTEVTYKYESNEVNQESDLITGNIYYIDFESETIPSTTQRGVTFTEVIFYKGVGQVDFTLLSAPEDGFIEMAWYTSGEIGFIVINDIDHTYYSLNTDILRFYGVVRSHDSRLGNLWQDFHYTDYNEIVSVTYHQPQTIIGYINEFFEENLLGEIPFIRDINFEIGGQNINLLTWVIMLIGLVIVGLLIFAFIKLIIWLVKIFSNSFLLR